MSLRTKIPRNHNEGGNIVAWVVTSNNRHRQQTSQAVHLPNQQAINPGANSIQESNYRHYPSRGMQETSDQFIMHLVDLSIDRSGPTYFFCCYTKVNPANNNTSHRSSKRRELLRAGETAWHLSNRHMLFQLQRDAYNAHTMRHSILLIWNTAH